MLFQKKGKPNIASLQPPTLATFRSWGSSAGADRAGLPGGKDIRLFTISVFGFEIFEKSLLDARVKPPSSCKAGIKDVRQR